MQGNVKVQNILKDIAKKELSGYLLVQKLTLHACLYAVVSCNVPQCEVKTPSPPQKKFLVFFFFYIKMPPSSDQTTVTAASTLSVAAAIMYKLTITSFSSFFLHGVRRWCSHMHWWKRYWSSCREIVRAIMEKITDNLCCFTLNCDYVLIKNNRHKPRNLPVYFYINIVGQPIQNVP